MRFFLLAAGLVLALAGCAAKPDPGRHATAAGFLFAVPHRAADSLASMPVSDGRTAAFARALRALIDGRVAAARGHAAAAGYAIAEKPQDGRLYRILFERDGAGIGPLVALAADPLRDAVIEAPHPVIDRATDNQAIALFFHLGARALVIAGANRCAARKASPCSGRTRVCGDGREPYRGSDAAHNTDTLFHRAHRVLTRRWPNAVAVQPHGFNNAGSPVWFVISDGSAGKRTGGDGLAGRVRDRIRASLGRRDRAVNCQDPADRTIRSRWLCATTNVQGRALNGSADACRAATERSTGRFLHIEQVYHGVRRGYLADWRTLDGYPGSRAVRDALTRELPCIRRGCTLGRTQ
jgi:hypothetical protein